jgi:hypothetical protein
MDEAKQVRAKEEHEHQARHSQHRNESAADDWCKQVDRGAKADDIANAQKPVPSLVLRISKELAQRHGMRFYGLCSLRHRLVEANAAEGAVFNLRAPPSESHCRRHRDRLAESSAALGAADEQERDDRTYETDHTDEGKVAESRPPKAQGPGDDDEEPGANGDSKSPPHSAFDVIADGHRSLHGAIVDRHINVGSTRLAFRTAAGARDTRCDHAERLTTYIPGTVFD